MSITDTRRPADGSATAGNNHPGPQPVKSPRRLAGELITAIVVIVALDRKSVV